MKAKDTSTSPRDIRRVARRRRDTTNRPNTMITSARKAATRRDLIITMIMERSMTMDTKSIMDIMRSMERKV
jgi:hypothetical protein